MAGIGGRKCGGTLAGQANGAMAANGCADLSGAVPTIAAINMQNGQLPAF
jgi:hypothetical protein